jgi:hypothetical protein
MKSRSFRERIGFALDGIRLAWGRDKSFRTKGRTFLVGSPTALPATSRVSDAYWLGRPEQSAAFPHLRHPLPQPTHGVNGLPV